MSNHPDLKQFKGKTRAEVAEFFEDHGYEKAGTDCYVLDGTDYMVKLCEKPKAVEAFVDICKKLKGNPFLPEIHDEFKLDEDTLLVVLEQLHKPPERKEEHTQFGICRAISTFITGDENHKDVHDMLMGEGDLVTASKEIVKVLADNLYKDEGCFFYHANPDNVWMRSVGETGQQPVFRNPFRSAELTPKIEEQVKKLCERFEIAVPQAPNGNSLPVNNDNKKGNGKPSPSSFGIGL